MGDKPFAGAGPTEEDLQAAYYSDHDLREMYSRENTERRRTGGHTFRKYLTPAQDKKLTAQFVKIREEYEVYNNNDAVIAFAQKLMDDGKGDDIDEKLKEICARTQIAKRLQEAPPA